MRTYCDAQHAIQRDAYAAFGLSFDMFGRSSNPPNHRLAQHFCEALEAAGLIEERVDRMVYSPTDGRFLPDRYVEGPAHTAPIPRRGAISATTAAGCSTPPT